MKIWRHVFAALSEDESLPSGLRFSVHYRPDRRVLREFEPLKPHLLEEMSAGNLTDIRQYVINESHHLQP
jgi:hypothetical protein